MRLVMDYLLALVDLQRSVAAARLSDVSGLQEVPHACGRVWSARVVRNLNQNR